jgi:cytochrome d ubiquinol oxidase subunit II
VVSALIVFLFVSIFLYAFLAGSDFGAGVIEFLTPRAQRPAIRSLISAAMGPVWEANHVWLILVVVILFNGFPGAAHVLFNAFHFPLLFLLLGIVLRGCAFTFRHYDAVKTEVSQRWYSRLFVLSSVITPFFFGQIIAGVYGGKIPATAEHLSFFALYVAPWWGWFPLLTGLFITVLFAFQGAGLMIAEAGSHALQRRLRRLSVLLLAILPVLGVLVFVSAHRAGIPLLHHFVDSRLSILSFAISTVGAIAFFVAVKLGGGTLPIRLAVGAITGGILLGYVSAFFPAMLITTAGPLSFVALAAPASSLQVLVVTLIGGSTLIFPSLYWLFQIFKRF